MQVLRQTRVPPQDLRQGTQTTRQLLFKGDSWHFCLIFFFLFLFFPHLDTIATIVDLGIRAALRM